MRVIVDTDVWSEALRKKKGKRSQYVSELADLIEENRVQMLGPIRMEVLSGIREKKQFERLLERLESFPDRFIESNEFVLAARFFNHCRSKGIQGSGIDFIICACCVEWGFPILSKDKDYDLYKKHLPIELHEIRGS